MTSSEKAQGGPGPLYNVRWYKVSSRAYGLLGELYTVDEVVPGVDRYSAVYLAFERTVKRHSLTWSEDGVHPPLISDFDYPPVCIEIVPNGLVFMRESEHKWLEKYTKTSDVG